MCSRASRHRCRGGTQGTCHPDDPPNLRGGLTVAAGGTVVKRAARFPYQRLGDEPFDLPWTDKNLSFSCYNKVLHVGKRRRSRLGGCRGAPAERSAIQTDCRPSKGFWPLSSTPVLKGNRPCHSSTRRVPSSR